MGEYARHKGQRIKIGTCESMYYLRFEDRSVVRPESDSLDPATETGLFWRLPFPDEDHVSPGNYQPHERGYPLYPQGLTPSFEIPEGKDHPGNLQLRHDSGLLINVPCYHGEKLPETVAPMRASWNGKVGSFWELKYVKNLSDGTVMPIVGCRFCEKIWRCDWEEVLPYIHDAELKSRLQKHVQHA